MSANLNKPKGKISTIATPERKAYLPLVGVTRWLIVIWEGDDAGADSENHGRVNLTVSVGGAVVDLEQVVWIHRDHARLFFQCIYVLNNPLKIIISD